MMEMCSLSKEEIKLLALAEVSSRICEDKPAKSIIEDYIRTLEKYENSYEELKKLYNS